LELKKYSAWQWKEVSHRGIIYCIFSNHNQKRVRGWLWETRCSDDVLCLSKLCRRDLEAYNIKYNNFSLKFHNTKALCLTILCSSVLQLLYRLFGCLFGR
jgi:hypothetical protein